MESIRIQQRTRPQRFAFIVRVGAKASLMRAASLNTALWGGIFNPIVPLKQRMRSRERERLWGLLKEYDPDFLINLSGAPLPQDIQESFPYRILEPSSFVIQVDGKNRFVKGVDIIPILQHAWEEEVRIAPGDTNAMFPEIPARDPWQTYVRMVFGEFPADFDVDYADHFKRALKTRTVAIPTGLAHLHNRAAVVPLRFTRYQLGLTSVGGSMPYFIIFVADLDSYDDLVEFWNLRATGRDVLLLPVGLTELFEGIVRQFIQRAPVREHPALPPIEAVKGDSIPESDFEAACKWLGSLTNIPLVRHSWIAQWGKHIPHVMRDVEVGAAFAEEREEASVLQDGSLTPVRLSVPGFLGEVRRGHEYSWSVTLEFSETRNDAYCLRLPRDPGVEQHARPHMVLGLPDEVRLAKDGLVFHQTTPRGFATVWAVPTPEAFAGLFQTAGFDVQASHPGRYADRIIDHMGGLENCRVFKIKGVREVFARLRNGQALQAAEITRIIGEHWVPALYGDLVLSAGQPLPLKPPIVFDHLVQTKLLRPGMLFTCVRCGKEEWYHVSQFDEQVRCIYCSQANDVGRLDTKRWYYKTSGVLMLPKEGQGSIPVILGLWRHRHTEWSAKYTTSLKLVDKRGRQESELDFALFYVHPFRDQYELVLGEARGMVDYTTRDISKLARVARRISPQPFLAFVTLKDQFSSEEKTRIDHLVQKGFRVIALTRQETDPYDLHQRFKTAPRRHAVSFEDLSVSTVALNL